MKPLPPHERERLLRQYRAMRCDALRQGVRTSLDHVPGSPTFVLSAWNPDGTESARDAGTCDIPDVEPR